jgi:hypothetical protein
VVVGCVVAGCVGWVMMGSIGAGGVCGKIFAEITTRAVAIPAMNSLNPNLNLLILLPPFVLILQKKIEVRGWRSLRFFEGLRGVSVGAD